MSSISQCREDINRYNNLKNKLIKVSEKLFSSLENLDFLSKTLNDNYRIDDDNAPCSYRISNLNNNIRKTNNNIKEKIIPAINVEISKLEKEIARLEYEKRAREERTSKLKGELWQ